MFSLSVFPCNICERQGRSSLDTDTVPTNGILGTRRAERNGFFEPGTFRILLAYRTIASQLASHCQAQGRGTNRQA